MSGGGSGAHGESPGHGLYQTPLTQQLSSGSVGALVLVEDVEE
jgi:hypothetical protein